MTENSIYEDIAKRTGGDIYIGVVGPVRTGKSTLIKRFMENLILPNIENEDEKQRAKDEMPQSATGKTVMTTEPKFVPENAVKIEIADNFSFNMKLIDCVGYIVNGAGGLTENDEARMVATPWSSEALPFEQAAELGTKKVITTHSTIGLMVTTDASFSPLERDDYAEAERRVITELKAHNKPFAIVLNCTEPESEKATLLAAKLEEEYKVPVAAVNCFTMGEDEIKSILGLVLMQFPIKEIKVDMPKWVLRLNEEHEIRNDILNSVFSLASSVCKMGDAASVFSGAPKSEYIEEIYPSSADFGRGSVCVSLKLSNGLFYKVLGNEVGLEIDGEQALFVIMKELTETKAKYEKIASALKEVDEKGYGIVIPDISELTLEEPEIVKQSGSYGVKLRASAPSIHMIRADIKTEVSPIVGSEKQSEDMVKCLLKEFEEDPKKIWQTNMFGKSLNELVSEGLSAKLNHMPEEARSKFSETLEKMINDGSGGLICIIL